MVVGSQAILRCTLSQAYQLSSHELSPRRRVERSREHLEPLCPLTYAPWPLARRSPSLLTNTLLLPCTSLLAKTLAILIRSYEHAWGSLQRLRMEPQSLPWPRKRARWSQCCSHPWRFNLSKDKFVQGGRRPLAACQSQESSLDSNERPRPLRARRGPLSLQPNRKGTSSELRMHPKYNTTIRSPPEADSSGGVQCIIRTSLTIL